MKYSILILIIMALFGCKDLPAPKTNNIQSKPSLLSIENQPVRSIDEIIGCWERVDFSQNAKKLLNKVEPWPIRYQWFCFETDGTLVTASSTQYIKQTSKTLRKATKHLSQSITYKLLKSGILQTKQKSTNQTLIWGLNFKGSNTFFDGKVIKKGTLIMPLYNQKTKRNIYYRYLTKLE